MKIFKYLYSITPLIILFASSSQAGYLYVSDYGAQTLLRYHYDYDPDTNAITAITPYGIGGNTTNAYFLGGAAAPVKEGIHGTKNDIILVGGYKGTGVTNLTRYGFDGKLIGEIPVNFSSYNGGNVGIGNTLVTPDGKYMYAPLEAAGYVVKIDMKTGSIVADYQFSKAHDIVIAPNGDVYAANYNAGGTSAKVIRLDSNLTYKEDLIAPNSSTFRPTGLSLSADGSILYVNNNTRGSFDSLLHYDITGTNDDKTATLDNSKSYIGSASNNKLEFTFGNSIGPGNCQSSCRLSG